MITWQSSTPCHHTLATHSLALVKKPGEQPALASHAPTPSTSVRHVPHDASRRVNATACCSSPVKFTQDDTDDDPAGL